MPSPKVPCPKCGTPKNAKASLCGKCGKGKYERTPEIRRKTSESMTGMKRPEVGKKIAAAWTPEMREAARLRGLAFADDPAWRAKRSRSGEAASNYQGKNTSVYGPGFGPGMKKRLIAKRGGVCESCGVEGRLDVHHKDFAKTDHSEANLEVVCRRCHKARHRAQRVLSRHSASRTGL